jgi:serine/threonine-protein kinase
MVDVIDRCLQRDPADRYANAAELALALEPLAPPESRVTVERARMAMGNTGRGRMASAPQLAVAETPAARPALTPAAWGSGKGGTLLSPDTKRGNGMWIGGGIAIAAVVAGAVFLLRKGDAPPVPAVTAAPPPTATMVVAPPVAPTVPAATIAPPPAASELPSAAPAASATVTPPAAGQPAAAVASPAKPLFAPPRSSAGSVTPKPKPKGDDIPSLR